MKLTRHNGRSGKHGTYNPRHNDRRFDVENSEHIDAERARQNIYWDCYRGFTTHEFRENPEQPDFSFGEIERMYYYEHYSDHVEAQNARNEKTRHTERNRTVEDLLKNNKTCPEESIYQIGTLEESVPPETLFRIVNEFYEEFERRFGSHIHILDWALHLDEGTPHIHERHVFDCENRYGELCPQQEKALEELGIPLPNPDKPKGRHNNRKQTFDAVCRTILFDITKRHGLHLDLLCGIHFPTARIRVVCHAVSPLSDTILVAPRFRRGTSAGHFRGVCVPFAGHRKSTPWDDPTGCSCVMLLSDGGRCCRCAAGGGRWSCGRCRSHRRRPSAGACPRYKA